MKKLGFGCMRLPLLDENDGGSIDVEQMKKMVDLFLERGFTYFDTALMYCDGKSEAAVKTALTSRVPREKFQLADKLHADYIQTKEDRDRVFAGQLHRTGVTYFDYYLLHDVGEDHYRKYTELDCFTWLRKKKDEGMVLNIGFSFHDKADLLDRVLTEHPEIDFVQLQINYLDWENIAIQSRECYEVACRHGKKVIVMEPVKGGTLANVPKEVEYYFKDRDSRYSVASWAIRFAASLDQVILVLSGMSNKKQVDDNTGYMTNFVPLTEDEKEYVLKAADMINANITIPCTGCSYCTKNCPMNIAIPKYFALYNAEEQEYPGKGWTSQGEYYHRLKQDFGKASDCIGCGQCENICPQHLEVMKYLKDVAKMFGS